MGAHDHTRATDQHYNVGHDHHDGCGPQCGVIGDERNRYYTGKYMTARDFRDEQDYFLSRHRLHNRLMHGWGVVCGLKVIQHRPECPGYVVVTPGIAIDCCGRELVLRQRTAVAVWTPPEQDDTAGQAEAPKTLTYLLYIHYHEEHIEPVPALYAEDCSAKRLEANRIREAACLAVIPWDDAHRTDPAYAGCWPPEAGPPEPCSRGCGEDDDTAAGCLDPACPCGLGVPLALVTLQREGKGDLPGYRVAPDGIDLSGREMLSPPKEYLTHIVKTSWEHGAVIPLSKLARYKGEADDMDGKLKIYFDRPLADGGPPPAPTVDESTAQHEQGREHEQRKRRLEYSPLGINRSTFTVEVRDPRGDRFESAILYDENNPPYWDPRECAAVFTIKDDWLEGSDDTIAGNLVYITLRCDFVLDCNDLAVDGDHLRGTLPTGDGIEGGTFESWFWVYDDGGGRRNYRREARRKKEEEGQARQQIKQGVQE